jgi:hypothetical protein
MIIALSLFPLSASIVKRLRFTTYLRQIRVGAKYSCQAARGMEDRMREGGAAAAANKAGHLNAPEFLG